MDKPTGLVLGAALLSHGELAGLPLESRALPMETQKRVPRVPSAFPRATAHGAALRVHNLPTASGCAWKADSLSTGLSGLMASAPGQGHHRERFGIEKQFRREGQEAQWRTPRRDHAGQLGGSSTRGKTSSVRKNHQSAVQMHHRNLSLIVPRTYKKGIDQT